ncbi:MAG: RidA family protein [Chloroflexi bacterium]|nr:RidA family protein [Chloroflexota bacterium]
MPVQRVNPQGIVPSIGMHHTVRAGNTLYISGQVAMDDQGNLVGPGDVEAQLRQVYRNLDNCLRAHGGALENIVSTTTYLADRAFRPALHKLRKEMFGDRGPANTTVVAQLGLPGLLVEIQAIAWIE